MIPKLVYPYDFHVHTTSSSCCHEATWQADRVVEKALALGLKEIGIVDHYFPGTDFDEVLRGAQTVASKAADTPLHVNSCVEVEVFDEKGSLAITPALLESLPYVLVGSGHIHLEWVRKPSAIPKDILDYIRKLHISLCENPYVDIIAHPWCALRSNFLEYVYGFCPLTVEEIPDSHISELCQIAAQTNTAVEINCSRVLYNDGFSSLYRRIIPKAAEFKTRLVLGSDAHRENELGLVQIRLAELAGMGLTQEMLWKPQK